MPHLRVVKVPHHCTENVLLKTMNSQTTSLTDPIIFLVQRDHQPNQMAFLPVPHTFMI